MASDKIYRAEKKKIREKANLKRVLIINKTQQDAADAFGVSSSTVSKKGGSIKFRDIKY